MLIPGVLTITTLLHKHKALLYIFVCRDNTSSTNTYLHYPDLTDPYRRDDLLAFTKMSWTDQLHDEESHTSQGDARPFSAISIQMLTHLHLLLFIWAFQPY